MKVAMTPTRWGVAIALLSTAMFVWWQQDEEAERLRLAAEAQSAALAASQPQAIVNGLPNPFAVMSPAQGARQAASANTAAGSGNTWVMAGAANLSEDAKPDEAGELSPEDKAVNDKLAQLGYNIAERYYRMPLSELRQVAASKDVQGLTHLAERYLFALDGKPQEPEHEPGFPYREAARNALTEAFLQGNRHAAAMISEAYLLERKPLDAATWNLVARRAGDDLSAEWFLRTQDYQQLSESSRLEAQRRADALWAELESKRVKKG